MNNVVTANLIPYRPFAYVDHDTNIMYGFDIDIIQAIGKEVGINITLQPTTWEKIFFNLLERKCDLVIAAMTITKQRLETIIFSEPYLTSGQIITIPEGSSIRDLKDLTEKQIGVLKNTTGDFEMTKMEEQLNLNKIKRYGSKTKLFTSLYKGDVDAAVIDQPLAFYFIKSNPELNLLTTGNIFTTESYAIAFRQESIDLRQVVNRGLKQIKEKGIYQEIYDKYFPNPLVV